MNNKQIIGYSIILAVILLFVFLPIHIYDAHPQGIPAIAGIMIAGTVFALAYLGVISEKMKPLFPIILALSFGIFAYRGCTGKVSELQNNGELAYGNASHQRVETSKRRGSTSTSKYIEYNFRAADGRKYYSSDYDVRDGSFTNVDLPILYSSKYPSVSVVLNSEENVKKYMKKKDATVATAEAFTKIVNETNKDSVFSYLRQLSPLWVKVHNTTPPTWTYRSSDATLEIDFESNQHVLCTTNREVQQRIKDCFQEAGYILVNLKDELDGISTEEAEEVNDEDSPKDKVQKMLNERVDREPAYYRLHNNKEGDDYKEILVMQEPHSKKADVGIMLQTQYCFYLSSLQDKMTVTIEDSQP